MTDDKMREAFRAVERALKPVFQQSDSAVRVAAVMALQELKSLIDAQASPVDAPTDAERLDWLDARRLQGVTKGYRWDTWGYDTDKPVRDQLDAAMRATPADGEVSP